MPRDTSLPGNQPTLVTFRYAAELYGLARKGLRPSLCYALGSKTSDGSNDRYLRRLIETIGDTPVVGISQSFADQWAQALYPHALSSTRKRQFYVPLNAVLGFSDRSGLCPATRLTSPPVSKAERTRCLQPEEVKRMLVAAKPHLALILMIALGTGATNSEVLNVECCDLDLDRREVAYPTRVAALPIELVALFRRVPTTGGKVIRRPDGEPYAPKANSAGQYKTCLRTLCRDARISDFCTRDLSTTYAYWHLALHQDLGKLERDSGWPERTIRRYRRVPIAELARLRDALFATQPPIIPGGLPRHPTAPWGG